MEILRNRFNQLMDSFESILTIILLSDTAMQYNKQADRFFRICSSVVRQNLVESNRL